MSDEEELFTIERVTDNIPWQIAPPNGDHTWYIYEWKAVTSTEGARLVLRWRKKL